MKEAEACRPAYEQKSLLFSRYKPLSVEAPSERLQCRLAAYSSLLDLVRNRLQFRDVRRAGRVKLRAVVSSRAHVGAACQAAGRNPASEAPDFNLFRNAWVHVLRPARAFGLECARSIVSLGHRIGLLFNAERYHR